ncbi:hypothetical protein ACX80W_11015 [Arthrobacter sp. TMN-37]
MALRLPQCPTSQAGLPPAEEPPVSSAAPTPWERPLGRAALTALQLLLLALFTVSVYALIQLRLVVIPLLLALILASAIGPFVLWLRRKGLSSSLATALAFGVLLFLIGGLITGVVFAVVAQTDALV